MHRVVKRTWLIYVFLLILMFGMAFFLWEYTTQAHQWVAFIGSPHLYNNSNIGCGTIVDRSGTILLDISTNRSYAADAVTRKSTLHWLGDREGKIRAGAVSHYGGAMLGFDPVNGIYNAGGAEGEMTLTLSAKVQNVALEALGSRKRTVAVYNYKTGELMCAVSTPTYDPNHVPDIDWDTDGTYEGVYLNRFLQSTYIPGSIFKVVTAAAALECVNGIQDMTFTCTGKVEYGEEKVTCESVHGKLDLKGALAHSCNCSFAQIAELVGKENMEEYVRKYQVTAPLSFDGITTAGGNYDISKTAKVSFAWSCIGQHTDQINPARFMTFMGAIAGGGKAALPHVVSRVRCAEELTYDAQTRMGDRLMPEKTAEILRTYLRNNVKNIYGDWYFQGLQVCAKSGTSQLGGGQTSNAMFAGFVENEEYPLAFIAVVENGGYGASTCLPVLSKVLAACKGVMDAG